ncbi:hypothetical protein [Streptomyces sp. NPDC059861]|uniref:hypothetical protein n=1 Tax=Streptomyces sp. NPDC059861 TaxID=3346974 RepID=UPI003661FF14
MRRAVGFSGTGWTCTRTPLACTRDDILQPGENHPTLTLTVNIARNAPQRVTNRALVTGGGTTATTTTVRRPNHKATR